MHLHISNRTPRRWRSGGVIAFNKLWKDDNHAVYIDGLTIKIDERLNYTHENPVKNGLVRDACDYIYSSANDYHTNQKSMVNIDFAI